MQGYVCDAAALGERRERAEDGARRPCGGGQLAADEAYRVLAEVLQAYGHQQLSRTCSEETG